MTEWDQMMSLIDALAGEPAERARARAQLLQMGAKAVEPLVQTMLSQNGRQAQAAAEMLGEFAEPGALDPLFTALCSPNPLLGWAALKSILRYPADETLIRLVEALPDAHLMVQQSMVLAMQELQDRRAVPALIRQLNEVESPTMRYAIIQTLGVLGDPQAIPAILAHENDADHHVREWVAVALRQLRSVKE